MLGCAICCSVRVYGGGEEVLRKRVAIGNLRSDSEGLLALCGGMWMEGMTKRETREGAKSLGIYL